MTKSVNRNLVQIQKTPSNVDSKAPKQLKGQIHAKNTFITKSTNSTNLITQNVNLSPLQLPSRRTGSHSTLIITFTKRLDSQTTAVVAASISMVIVVHLVDFADFLNLPEGIMVKLSDVRPLEFACIWSQILRTGPLNCDTICSPRFSSIAVICWRTFSAAFWVWMRKHGIFQ